MISFATPKDLRLRATALDVEILRKCFGGFLILIGLRELFKKG